ncbi:MAG: 4Fe-4S binding protein [Verrucomicrobiales bacterium]|nr:4Fe-4S binding protein [Verrucomicrobiales bacterium]MCP5526769.1 4Fe-4S binding protein [Verrucomicrobiales bacterium]
MRARGLFIWIWLLLGLGATVFAAERRFPPPEFETDYVMPVAATPEPRSAAMQYVDLAVLAGGLGLATWLALRRRSRKGLIGLSIFSLVYFGFYRAGCICAIGAPQNVALGLFDNGYAIPFTALAFFILPLAVALFAGRTFCAAVCPHGALQDLILIRPVKVPAWLEAGLGLFPYFFLGAGLLFAATGATFLFCRYDPFVPLFRMNGSFLMVGLGLGLLVLGMFVGRPYCRFVCPYGALLRMAAAVSRWRIRITPNYCTQCRLCEESCPYGAIREPVNLPSTPQALAPDRRRMGRLLVLLPALILATAWLGSRLATPFSKLHPKVALAEAYHAPDRPAAPPPVATPDSLALARADRDPDGLLAEAVAIRKRFRIGGWLFGGWIGLVLGVRLMALSLRPARNDFEPDRSACLACGRCYTYCPNERVRLGLLAPEALPLPPATLAQPPKA